MAGVMPTAHSGPNTSSVFKQLESKRRLQIAAQRAKDGKRKLVVFVGGLQWSRELADYGTLTAFIAKTLPEHDVVDFPYNAKVYSSNNPDAVAEKLQAMVTDLVAEEGYSELMFVGHSYGTVLIRAVILDEHRNLGRTGSIWYSKLDRLVLLAPTNRGYEPTTGMESAARTVAEFAQWLPMMKIGRQALSVMRGSSWLNNFRLRWLEEFHQYDPPPYTVVILGKDDRIVGEDDAAEVYQFPHADKKVVPNIGHGHFTLYPKPPKPGDSPARQNQIEAAINLLAQAIREGLTQPKGLAEGDAQRTTSTIRAGDTHTIATEGSLNQLSPFRRPPPVVFLVHGIRDFAEWQETLGEEVKRLNSDAIVVPVVYGYFTALQFLYRTSRKRAMRTFVDRYTQMRAVHPRSSFHVAAHSNGTWVIAYSLKENPAFKFDNVYLCGSVLSRKFPWYNVSKQVRGSIRNDCANRDWPVGVLCSTLSWFPFVWSDLGSGGVDGFVNQRGSIGAWIASIFRRQPNPDPNHSQLPTLRNNYYLSGDHGAALRKENHASIAAFLLGQTGPPLNLSKRSPFWSRLKYFIVFLIVASVIATISSYIPDAASFTAGLLNRPDLREPFLLGIWTVWILLIVSRLIKV